MIYIRLGPEMQKPRLIIKLDKLAKYFGYRFISQSEFRGIRDGLMQAEKERAQTHEKLHQTSRRLDELKHAISTMVYHHDYPGGYAQYREVQIAHNKRKLDQVWADEATLNAIAVDLAAHGLGKSGLCHGARNGFEVEWLRERTGGDVIGTDISPTAAEFPHMLVWDFHDENPEWAGAFDFVYTNSLDQAMAPDRALAAWSKQIVPGGRIYIEHTMAHAADRAGEMDPFGAHPMAMPFLFFNWGRDQYHLVDIIKVQAKENKEMPAWVFVLARNG